MNYEADVNFWLESIGEEHWQTLLNGIHQMVFCPQSSELFTGFPECFRFLDSDKDYYVKCVILYRFCNNVSRSRLTVDHICWPDGPKSISNYFTDNKINLIECKETITKYKIILTKSTNGNDILIWTTISKDVCKPWSRCWIGQPTTRLENISKLSVNKADLEQIKDQFQSMDQRLSQININELISENYKIRDNFIVHKSLQGWFESNVLLVGKNYTLWLKINDDNKLTNKIAYEVRLKFQQFMASSKVIKSPKVLLTSDGKNVVTLTSNMFCYLIEYLGDDAIDFGQLQEVSENQCIDVFLPFADLLGKFHSAQQQYEDVGHLNVERWSPRTIVCDVDNELKSFNARRTLLWYSDSKNLHYYKLIVSSLLSMKDACVMTAVSNAANISIGWNHADIHEYNVMISGDSTLNVIDYGDVTYGPLVIDLAFLLVRCLSFGKSRYGTQKDFINLIQEYRLFALSITDALESFERDLDLRESRRIYIDRSLRALEFCVFDDSLHRAINNFLTDAS
ncbi:hypothetical protein GJ496_003830 [Pomphorhynchus laevis]|nr:hypothetical protein GJ496_003830 [Pomphorhynchus laevis]